jgi:hypothetical protein
MVLDMEGNIIRHRVRHMTYTRVPNLEIERDILDCPEGQPHVNAQCPDCGCAMLYRGIGQLTSGSRVHHFECIHSHREVHSLSIYMGDR